MNPQGKCQEEVVPVGLGCKHVWRHISGYLDGTLDAEVLAQCKITWSTVRYARRSSTPRATS
jgi:hypothetical protein